MNRREAVAGLVGLVTSGHGPKKSNLERKWRVLASCHRSDSEAQLQQFIKMRYRQHQSDMIHEETWWNLENRHVTVNYYADGSADRYTIWHDGGAWGDSQTGHGSRLLEVSDPPLRSVGQLPMI